MSKLNYKFLFTCVCVFRMVSIGDSHMNTHLPTGDTHQTGTSPFVAKQNLSKLGYGYYPKLKKIVKYDMSPNNHTAALQMLHSTGRNILILYTVLYRCPRLCVIFTYE